MGIARRSTPVETEFVVDGAFDSDSAAMLKALVLDAEPGDRLVLDFRGVRLFHDCAIEALAEALSRHAAVTLVGLSEHHYRLLRYVAQTGASQPHGAA